MSHATNNRRQFSSDWILFEDNHLFVVSKPSGVPVQQDKTKDPSLDQMARDFLRVREKKSGEAYVVPVHRIDRPTSGIVVHAKTSKAARRLGDQFRNGLTEKTYLAWLTPKDESNVLPLLEQGAFTDTILKKPHGTSVIVPPGTPKGKKSKLDYKVVKSGTRRKLVEVDLDTGRHHQIRVQFASRGWVVVGDKRYGAKRAIHDKSIALHAWRICIEHPTTKERLSFEAPLPDLWEKWGPKTGK